MARRNTPEVTGVSPKEGAPGTRVTIRGENLGSKQDDIIGLKICGADCLLTCEWKSKNKIIARTGDAKGKGDIIVTTQYGGVGTCTVQFRGYLVTTSPIQDSAVWVDESQTWSHVVRRHRITSPLMSTDQDDPLGISDETNDAKFQGDLAEMFPDGSGNTSEEGFAPAWFLLENHHGTSFEDLKAGLAYLKRNSSKRNEGPLAFVKANMTTFMDCQDTLTDMHLRLVEDQVATPSGHITQGLEDVLVKANRSADRLFQDVLGRKDRADATRNALAVLQRFKFLFSLPSTIDRNIRGEDYDLAITDYMRAKSLFGDTEIQVFRSVYQEVEKRIVAFREKLYEKIMHLPSPVEEQKKYIKFLVQLETCGDPAWECIDNEYRWLEKLLVTCKDEHLSRDLADAKTDPAQKNGKNKHPQKVEYVDELTRTLAEHLPDFWRLGQSYLSGRLGKDPKDKPAKIDSSKHTQFKTQLWSLIVLFSRMLRAAFLPHSLKALTDKQRPMYGVWRDNTEDAPIAWLPVCVRCVRSCVLGLVGLELPSECTQVLQELAFDMRVSCMQTLLQQTIHDVSTLRIRETWTVEADDQHGGMTQLPALFENLVSETVQHLQEVLCARPGETDLFAVTVVQTEAVQLVKQLMQGFATLLDTLAMIGNEEKDSGKSPRNAIRSDMFESGGKSNGMPSLEKRLMTMLSNCQHMQYSILPRLLDNLHRHGYPELNTLHQVCESVFAELDTKLFEQYCEEKANPIIGALEDNMYAGRFDWNDCLTSTGVRRYIKEALMGMIRIHAEVYSISPRLVQRVMCHIVEAVVDELCRLIQCVMGFNRNGALQARLELYSMELAISAYRTEGTQVSFSEAIGCLQEVTSPEDKRLLEDLINQFQSQMRFQLLCFQPDAKTMPR